jgi:hypothetical protein
MKTKGAKNITPFGRRTGVETSSSKEVRHLANIKGTPLSEFQGLLNHQVNFLAWVDTRHDMIVGLKKDLYKLKKKKKGKGPTGAKEATFVKYRWYAEQLVLLEAINAFETFYKKTFIGVGAILQEYVQPELMRPVKIEARLLWSITDAISVPALVFEQSLFHDLEAIDGASDMLIGKRRYNQNSHPNPLEERVKALRAIFQIRHTLSHNSGLVTESDGAKFRRLKFDITTKEVIDPAKNHLGLAVFRELEAEAKDFTSWLADKTATFLEACITDRGLEIPTSKQNELESLLGPHASWATVPWS